MITTPYELQYVSKNILRHAFNITYPTIHKWEPDLRKIDAVNGDGTYDLIKIIEWRTKKAKVEEISGKQELEIQKLEKDIELKDAQINKVNENYIERPIANQEKVTLLKIIRLFLEKVPSYRKQLFHMIPADIAEKRLRDVLSEAMNQIANAPENVEE